MVGDHPDDNATAEDALDGQNASNPPSSKQISNSAFSACSTVGGRLGIMEEIPADIANQLLPSVCSELNTVPVLTIQVAGRVPHSNQYSVQPAPG